MKISKKQLTKACWYNIICKDDVRRNSLHQSPGVNLFSIEPTMKIISKLKFIGGQPMKTYMANPDKIERKWYVVDAEGQTLGRLAAEVAKVLRGKNKPEFTPHIDTGDNVIVINAEKIKVTGKKLDQKVYYHHSDYVGGMKETTLREMMAKKPEQVIELAVKGMLPKGPLGRTMIKKLHVYAGAEQSKYVQQHAGRSF